MPASQKKNLGPARPESLGPGASPKPTGGSSGVAMALGYEMLWTTHQPKQVTESAYDIFFGVSQYGESSCSWSLI